MNPQVRALAHGVDVLVATPGRLLDLMHNRAVQLDRVEVFVLDEADRMLDMGFIHDIRRIVGEAAGQASDPVLLGDHAAGDHRARQFHAEGPGAGRGDAGRHHRRARRPARDPGRPRGEARAAGASCCAASRSTACWSSPAPSTAPTRSCARSQKSQIAADAIHGNKSQNQRERALAAFRAGKVRTLVATDIAARGIDVDGISHVVNFDLPNMPESYVHRIGRTARAGADGIAISFCDGEERAYLRDIEKLIRIAIPSTDQRGARHGSPQAEADAAPAPEWTPHRSPKANGNGKRQPNRHRQDKQQQARSEQPNRQHAAQPQQSRNGQQGQPQRNGQNHQQSRNGQQDQPQRNGQGHQQPRNGHQNQPKRNGQHHQKPRNGHQHQQSRSQPQSSSDGSIASVGFLQPTQRQKHHAGGLAARRSAR